MNKENWNKFLSEIIKSSINNFDMIGDNLRAQCIKYFEQLEQDKTHLIEIISGLINYVKDTYNEDLTDKTAEVMEIVLDKVGGSNE